MQSRRTVALATLLAFGIGATIAFAGVKKGESGKSASVLEIRKDKKGKLRFFYIGKSGKTLAMCVRGYATPADAQKDIDQVKLLISVKSSTGKSGLVFSKDKRGATRFSIKDAKGKTLAMGTRGFKTQADAEKVIAEVKALTALKPRQAN